MRFAAIQAAILSFTRRGLRRLRPGMVPERACAGVDTRGPVFISYRQSDGRLLATATAWALRAAGVPVWQDQDDLPPGATDQRLTEALRLGLSGAVLLVTEEVARSRAVREVELPQLLRLADCPAFTLAIASTITNESGKLDYTAPDRLLQRRPGTLQQMKQEPVSTARDRADIARAQARRRMQAIREDVATANGVLVVDLQTRIPPFAARADADLVVRLRPPVSGDRRPHRRGVEDLMLFLADLPDLVVRAGAEHLHVRGGAHLSVAFAFGAAIPTTFRGRVEVAATDGKLWVLAGDAAAGLAPLLTVESSTDGQPSEGPVAVFLDLLPTQSDVAFDHFIVANQPDLAAFLHLRALHGGSLDAADAAALVGEAAYRIRTLAGEYRTRDVHLLLRCPWNVALLLGRTLNTLRLHLYEWEDGPDEMGNPAQPRYLPSLIVRSGAGGSPIERVLLPFREAD